MTKLDCYYCKPDVEGEIILEETGRKGQMHAIVFQTKYHKKDEYDVLYENDGWKSYVWDGAEYREDIAEELDDDNLHKIAEFVRDTSHKLKACTDIPELFDSWEAR